MKSGSLDFSVERGVIDSSFILELVILTKQFVLLYNVNVIPS